MRIVLDEQLSPRRVGEPIARHGHDVACVASESGLRGLTDHELLTYVAAERRVLITRNARDFVPIARDWADAGRRHAGILVIWSRDTDEFGALVAELVEALAAVGGQRAWANLTRSL